MAAGDVHECQLAQIQRDGPASVDHLPKTVEQVVDVPHVEFADEREMPVRAEVPDVERPISSDLERPVRGHGVLHEERERQRYTAAEGRCRSTTGRSR